MSPVTSKVIFLFGELNPFQIGIQLAINENICEVEQTKLQPTGKGFKF
jgi:hypothetical protein